MGSTAQQGGGFYSTPAFEIFRRGLTVQTVKKFRGLNAYAPITQLTPDVASDLLNVVVTSSGQLAKLRLPVPLSAPIAGIPVGPFSFWDFQQGNGTRQVLAHFGEKIYWYDPAFAAATLIDTNPLNLSPWSFVAANNILFGANSQRMQKWTGTSWQQWGINAPIVAPLFAAVTGGFTAPISNNPVAGYGVGNYAGTTNTFIWTVAPFPGVPGQSVIIAGNSEVTFNATWPILASTNNAGPAYLNQFTLAITTAGISDGRTGINGTVTLLGTAPTVGWKWAYAYKNSVTGHVGIVSPPTAPTIPTAGKVGQLTALATSDTQVDTLVWYRTLDGGGDLFRMCEVNLLTGAIASTALPGMSATPAQIGGAGPFLVLNDNGTGDSSLDQTSRASFINAPPPVGTFVALAQGRVFVAGLIGAGSDVAFSGYEQIVIGRPEESFPTNNRLRLSLGAEAVVGLGVLHSGIVMFSSTGKMWMLRGAIEDITLNAPIAFSEFLEELPWTLGCLSHYTIQDTPYGLVWLAGDKTVQFWDGKSDPVDISQPIYPILRSITPGTEGQCVGSYFNWLERDWYALSVAVNGSPSPNVVIFFSLEKDGQQIDCFVSTLQADWLGIQSTATRQRRLLMSHGGIISEVPVRATDINGITNDFTTYPPTSGTLSAYWRSGPFGNESAEQSKMWRWSRLVTDGGITDYRMQYRIIDDVNLATNPTVIGPVRAQGMRTPINARGYRCAVEIDFPEDDAPMNVLELQVAYIATSQR